MKKKCSKRDEIIFSFIDLENAFGRINWEVMWDVLRAYVMGGRLISDVKAFYKDANVFKINEEVRESFRLHRGVRQGYVMSPCLFSLVMDGVVREVKARVGNVGVELCTDEAKWKLNTMLFTVDNVLIAENEKGFARICKGIQCGSNFLKSENMQNLSKFKEIFTQCR